MVKLQRVEQCCRSGSIYYKNNVVSTRFWVESTYLYSLLLRVRVQNFYLMGGFEKAVCLQWETFWSLLSSNFLSSLCPCSSLFPTPTQVSSLQSCYPCLSPATSQTFFSSGFSFFFFFSLQPLDVGTPRSPCWALLSLTPRDLILSPRLSSALISTNTIYQQRTCLLYFWLWPLWTPDTSIPTIVAQNRRDLEFKYPRQNSWYISCISHLVLP